MADETPIRDLERLVLRVPEGLKERLEIRARAHGRSMNAEAVAILSQALEATDVLGMRALREEKKRLVAEEAAVRQTLDAVQSRMIALNKEIMARNDRARAEGYKLED